MPQFKEKVELIAARLLRRAGVPEEEMPETLKKTGRGMILFSVLLVVPLLLASHVPLAVTIVLQLGYAALISTGVILAFDDENKVR
ncbi:hypothetical protein [Enterobacter sp.]|uniref:hypothetical protein n=1 Tax=Enterobacter sp. TaxID=42895 RepID=UPI00296E6361|nr:hypothetical protein [Enterobacter sp.]